jgi:hypothetical protein
MNFRKGELPLLAWIKMKRALVILFLYLMPEVFSFGQEPGPLVNELLQLHTDTALIVPSQAVDEFPL